MRIEPESAAGVAGHGLRKPVNSAKLVNRAIKGYACPAGRVETGNLLGEMQYSASVSAAGKYQIPWPIRWKVAWPSGENIQHLPILQNVSGVSFYARNIQVLCHLCCLAFAFIQSATLCTTSLRNEKPPFAKSHFVFRDLFLSGD
jgi:hypothetical protein